MRKSIANFNCLIIGIIGSLLLSLGGFKSYAATSYENYNGIDLTECYMFRVDAGTEYAVCYSTSTQSNINAPKFQDGTKSVYYVSASESPTRISVYPQSGNGISAVKSGSTNLASHPDNVYYYTSTLTMGEVYDVTIKPMNEVRCGTMTITVDDPTDIRVQRKTGNATRTYLASDFTNNNLTVKYDPNTELDWTISHDGKKRIYKTLVNGTPAVRSEGGVYTAATTMTYQTYMPVILSGTTSDVVVTVAYPENSIPLKIAINPTEGSSENNPAYLNSKITKVTVNGSVVDRSEWDADNFTVKNGSSVGLTFDGQMRTVFELGTAHLNGVAQTSRTSFLIESYDSNPTAQTISVDALVNNPWRYNLKSNGNYDKFGLYFYSTPEEVNSTDFNGTTSYTISKGSVRPIYNSGYKVTSVQFNGQALTPVMKDRYEFPAGQDMKIEVTTAPYTRDQKINLFADATGYGVDVTLDPDGTMSQRVELNPGNNQVSVNTADFPIRIHSASPYVYLNGVCQEADENGYYLANYNVGDIVKILNKPAYNVVITYGDIDGTIYHDGKVVAANNSYEVLQGTEIKVVPRSSATNLVLQTGPASFATKQADKSFVFFAQNTATVSLHPENPKVTVKINSNDNNIYQQIRVTEGSSQLALTSNNTQLILPYYADRSTYTLTFKDSKNIYDVTDVSFSPSTGASYDAASQTATGVKDGMTLTVYLAKPDKPFKVDLTVMPNSTSDCEITYNASTGQWDRVFNNSNESARIILKTGNLVDEYGNQMPGAMLNYGVNNPKTVDDLFYNAFVYSAEDVFEDGIGLLSFESNYIIVRHNNTYLKVSPNTNPMNPDFDYLLEPYAEPRSLVGKIYTNPDESASPLTFEPLLCDFMWSVDGSEWQLYSPDSECLNYPQYFYSWGNGSENLIRLYHGTEIKVKPLEGESFKTVTLKGRYNDFVVKPDAEGVYTMLISYNEQDLYINSPIIVEIEGYSMTINASTNVSDYGAFVSFDEDDHDFLTENEEEYIRSGSDTFKFKCSPEYMMTGVTDLGTGKNLPFDADTYTAYGFYDGIRICVNVEKIERSKTITVYYPKSSASSAAPNLTLASGKAFETSHNLYASTTYKPTPVTEVKFFDLDLPFVLSNGTYSSARSVFINDKQIAYNSATKTYAMPTSIEDGSEMYIVNGSSASAAVTYEIDEDIPVSVKHGARSVADRSTGFETVPAGTIITVQSAGDTKYNYAVEYSVAGADYNALPASGYTVVAAENVTVRVVKTYNTITVNAAAGTDLATLLITADGETYTVAPGQNVVNIPTHVTSMTITTTENGKYIDIVDGLTFDNATGTATGLKTGTITVGVTELEREKEVVVFVDSEDLTDGVLVLGNGKVIETGASIEEGYNTINFSEEDLPIIYRITEFAEEMEGDVDPSQLPVVYVNGEKLEYSPEYGGYVFPVEAFLSDEAPVIKIYPPTPQGMEEVAPVNLTYLVEPGITFKAIEDRVTEVTEAGMRSVLPGTEIVLEAKADNGDDIFVEIDGQRIAATDGKCTLSLGNTDMVISVKFEKLNVTLKSEEWSHIKISGAGLVYPMYDAVSSLEFPQKTAEFRLTSSIEGRRVIEVTDESGADLQFNATTGILTGVKAGMTLNIVMGDYIRNASLMVYLEETVEEEDENAPISHLVLAPATAVEKTIALNKGYQTVMVANDDLPLAVTTIAGVNATVFLNNEEVEMVDGIYSFPAELPENSIVKIFVERPEGIAKAEVTYDFYRIKDYVVSLTHDNMPMAVDTKNTHRLLPGTEIRFTVSAINAQTPDFKTLADETAAPFTVKVNDEELEPQQDGSYMVKVNDDHIANGLKIEVVQDGVTSAIDMISADSQAVDIYGLNGVMIKKGATAADISRLPAGIYIVNGTKTYIGRNR